MQLGALFVFLGGIFLVKGDDVVFIEEYVGQVVWGADILWGYVQNTPRECLELCQSQPDKFAQTKSFDHWKSQHCYCNKATIGEWTIYQNPNWRLYHVHAKLSGVRIYDVDNNAMTSTLLTPPDMRDRHFLSNNGTEIRYVFIAEGTAIPPASRIVVSRVVECAVLCATEEQCNLYVMENVNGTKYCSMFYNMY